MPKTEIEFKIHLANKSAKEIVLKQLSQIFDLRLKERRHLESDFLYHLPGDIKLRARYWQEFYANSPKLHIKKYLTVKLPRKSGYHVVDNNEVEFELNESCQLSENYQIAKNTIESLPDFPYSVPFDEWISNLVKVKDIFHFERQFQKLYTQKRANSRDKIRVLYSTDFNGNEVEICFDELPSKHNPLEHHYFIEFSCDNRDTLTLLKETLKNNLGIVSTDLDLRGYGKIIRDENFGFKFKEVT